MTKKNWLHLYIKNRHGLKLSCLKREVSRSESFIPGFSSEKAVVVVCHGFTGSKEGGGRALLMGNQLAAQNFDTILFDFSGCGESEGTWPDLTLTNQIEDLGSVVEWCFKNGYSKIILTGRSFGGSTVIEYAASDSRITALCTWAAVARPADLFLKLAQTAIEGPEDEIVNIQGEGHTLHLKKRFFYDLSRHDILKSAASLAPLNFLVIHGTADESVAIDAAYLLYNAANEPKELRIIEGADHRFSDHMATVWQVFFQWLEKLN